MGGAIAVHAACQEMIPSLIGLVVIDVVEGKLFSFIYQLLILYSNNDIKFIIYKIIDWVVLK